jgi:hypothetical protein
MDRLREFLDALKKHALAQGNFLGLLNVLVGRRIHLPDGTLLTAGLTWRELAALLKRVRWDKDAVREFGLDPAALPPRDRLKYWYTAIAQSGLDSAKASQAGDEFARKLEEQGYRVGSAPGGKQA